MSSLQFASQIFMARTVLAAGLVKRKNQDKLSWRQYCVQGAASRHSAFSTACPPRRRAAGADARARRAVVPNGTATGLDIGLSNFSLSLITLSFYTMCKSTTPIFLLAFCFLWGIERRAPAAPPRRPGCPRPRTEPVPTPREPAAQAQLGPGGRRGRDQRGAGAAGGRGDRV